MEVSGFGTDFNAEEFRTAIRNTMMMGLPNTVAERATFRWNIHRDFSIEDKQGNPYDFSKTPINVVDKPDVQVPVAVEFRSNVTGSEGVSLGEVDTPRCVITVLDVDQVNVEGADLVVLGGDSYRVNYVEPPIGLFSVTVYRWHCQAIDETR